MPELLDSMQLVRGTYYAAIVLGPLIETAKPYCLGSYCVAKGFDASCLDSVHRLVKQVGKKYDLRIIALPGDGDSTLRSLQWGYFTDFRGFEWLSSLSVPIDLKFHMFEDKFTFSLQDPLHCLKKLRNHLKYLETRCLLLHKDPTRYYN